ncbi:MAG: hypothetical protein IPM71_00885 [Bacteroidota bacterium]|nr:MAG: hypothetical protein IPM71_00885 [Bacteroidota bacterium]
MRPLFFFLITLFFIPSLYAQSRFGLDLSAETIFSTSSRSNTLYTGIDNYLELKLDETMGYDSIILQCNNGKVFFDSCYVVIPRRPGSLRIEVFGFIDDNIDTLGYKSFKVNTLPSPQLAFDEIIVSDSILVDHKDFINADTMFMVYTNDLIGSDKWLRISEFTIGYNYGGYYIGESNNNGAITQEMKELVLNKGIGRWMSVKVICQANSSLFLSNIIYRVLFY